MTLRLTYYVAHLMSHHSRASTLRSYAGDTALPGGKVDPDDESIEDTAVSALMLYTMHFTKSALYQ